VFRVQGSGLRIQGSGFRVQGSWFRVHGSWFRVQGSGFRVQGQGSRFRVQVVLGGWVFLISEVTMYRGTSCTRYTKEAERI